MRRDHINTRMNSRGFKVGLENAALADCKMQTELQCACASGKA